MDRKNRGEPSCVLCSLQFSFKDPTNPVGARCPLLLQCGHSVCEGCMRSITRGGTSVTCTICSAISEANKFKSPQELREEFPLNIYAVGQVSLKRVGKGKMKDSVIGFYSQKKKMTPDLVLCCECSVAPADCSCRQCNVQFCSPCFIRIHSTGVTLRKHEKIFLDDSEKTTVCEEVMCKEHPGKILKMFCSDCFDYYCKDCISQNHDEHSFVEVLQKNQEILQEFSEVYNEANAVLNQLLVTKKKLQNSGTAEHYEDSLKIEKEVAVHYNHLHGILQLQEEKLLKKIRIAQEQTHNSLLNVANNLETNIKEMETILNKSKTLMDPNNLNNIPLEKFLEILKNITAMPCHLILKDHQKNTSKFGFYVDTAVTKMLEAHCTVDVPTTREYVLCSKFDLPDNFVIENSLEASDSLQTPDLKFHENSSLKPEESTSKTALSEASSALNLPKAEVKTKTTSYQEVLRKNRLSLNTTDAVDTHSTSSTESTLENICNITPLQEGSTEVVRICHLISPNSFYVQRKCSYGLLQKLRDHFSKQANIKRSPPTEIELGNMYLVQFAADTKWYRALVNKMDTTKNKFKVFYIDYGNSEEVIKNKLREIPEKYKKIPEQAIHCSLYGCVPVGGQWTENAFKMMASMSNGVDLFMHVDRVNPLSGLHEVHLRSIDDICGSFTDALIFLNLATEAENTKTERGLYKQLEPPLKRTFFKDPAMKKNDTFNAHVTHVNTPTNFYVQKVTDGNEFILQLMRDMTNSYSHLKPNDQMVYCPTVGMPVAAKYSDGQWYRGIVLKTPKPCYVQVQYVDFGNVATVHWLDIRILQPKFLRMGVQGIKCSLSDVTSKYPQGWTTSGKKSFENMTKDTIVRVYVEDVKETFLSVVLYSVHSNKDICLNGLLVKQGHALSIGPSSAKSEYLRRLEKKSNLDLRTATPSVSKHQNYKTISLPSVYQESDKKQKYVQSTKSSASSDTNQTNEESEYDSEAARIKIKVLKCVSPAEIYVTFDNVFKQIIRLSEQMTDFYGSSVEEDREWNLDDLCAVLRSEDNMWYRGLITVAGSKKYKVYIKDIVEFVEVDQSSLRSLDPQFKRVMDGSVKCHLSAILPPGGGKTWPSVTIEQLCATFQEYSQFYINKLGELENNSLPVQLWIKRTKFGGALEPVKEEWIDMARFLIDSGLALPDRNSENYSVIQATESTFSPKDDSPNNESQKALLEWLQNSYEVAAQSGSFSDSEKVNSSDLDIPHPIRNRHKSTGLFSNLSSLDSSDITDWLPAEPFEKQDFIAVPTYVDYDCAIYLQDKKRSAFTLEVLQKALCSLFSGSTPKPHDLVWSEGQICIAFYELDSKWYRGKVLKVTDAYIEVLFVDYGNTEKLQPEELRKKTTMGNIPLQCHRCLTEGLIPISPDGKWPIKALDFIHGTIVDQECKVSLKPPTAECNNYVILKLNMPDDEDLMEVLQSMHYATYMVDCNQVGMINEDEEEIIVDSGCQESFLTINKNLIKSIMNPKTDKEDQLDNLSDTSNITPIIPETHNQYIYDWFDMTQFTSKNATQDLKFNELVLPDSLVELKVSVQVVASSTSLKVNIVDCDDPEVMSVNNDFYQLETTIQEEAEKLPFIADPIEGLPCVGRFTQDDVWYRAIIKEVMDKEDLVTVQYVDYGNEENIPLERIREIKEEWTKTPLQTLHVNLFSVKKGPNYDTTICQNMLMNCLMSPPYLMTIEARQPSLQVELYNSDGELAYQTLIDMGILEKT